MPPERAPTTKPFKPQRPSNSAGASTSANASSSRRDTNTQSSRTQQSSRPSQSQSEPEPEPESDEQPAIPPELLTTLLHEFFTDDRTRISKAANDAVGKYMETFVREAIARAAFERRQAAGAQAAGGVGDFLEVEDLEKLAPQLVLDF